MSPHIQSASLWSPVRLAHGLLPVVSLLEQHNIDVDALLDQARIARFGLMDPAYTISIDQELALLTSAIRALPQAGMSLIMARQYRLRGFSVLGLAMQASASPLSMLRLIMQFPRLAWGLFDSQMSLRGDELGLSFAPQPRLGTVEGFLAERDFACAVVLFSEATGSTFPLRSVSFRHACTDDIGRYEDFFDCPVTFDAASTAISCSLTAAQQSLPQGDPTMCSFFTAQCERMSQDMDRPFRYAQTVHERLLASVVMPDLNSLADGMFLTARTLQRRLSAEGASYSQLLREARQQRAHQLLQESGSSMEQIATQLGFSDAVAFSHAFKSWHGISPQQWRQRAQVALAR